jgi:single-strand DNA-binding protein
LVNKVTLIGRAGADPKIIESKGGKIANLSLATSFTYTKDGERHEKTEWHQIVAFGKLAEVVERYLAKGQLIYIEGRLQTRSWDDNKTGETKYKTEVVADVVRNLSPRGDAKPAPQQSQTQVDPAGEEGPAW